MATPARKPLSPNDKTLLATGGGLLVLILLLLGRKETCPPCSIPQ